LIFSIIEIYIFERISEKFYYFRKRFKDTIHLKILSDKSDVNEIEF